jgi:hypothetical protein
MTNDFEIEIFQSSGYKSKVRCYPKEEIISKKRIKTVQSKFKYETLLSNLILKSIFSLTVIFD